MPAPFDYCSSHGGKIRTKSLSNGGYMHICFLEGKSYPGEVHKKKDTRTDQMKSKEKLKKGMLGKHD